MNKMKAILTVEIAKLYVNSCARTVEKPYQTKKKTKTPTWTEKDAMR
jgi:hypothetical protein